MKLFITGFFLFMLTSTLHAQQGVSVGHTTPHPAAALDISKTTKGFLMPRVTQSARITISSPAGGLLLYDTSSDRMFQRQKNNWQFFLDNTYWVKNSQVFNRMYTLDSVGIGNAAPSRRLDVTGNIRARSGIIVENNLSASNKLEGYDLTSATNVAVSGQTTVGADITTQSSVNIDNSNPLIQFTNAGVNKAYAHVSSDDWRLGTNTGNGAGKIIIRMDGTNIISIDTFANFKVLTAFGGNLSIGPKLSRQFAYNDNMLPIISGKVNADGTLQWASSDVQVTKSGADYFILCYAARVNLRSSILVTAGGSLPRMATATFISPGYFKVIIYDPVDRMYMPTNFSFIVHDALNL